MDFLSIWVIQAIHRYGFSTHPPLTCVILVLFAAQHQSASPAVNTSPATTDITASTSANTGLQSSIPGN